MKPYVISLAAGLLIGVIYSLLGVRSPAPPAIALVGLLGILLGEQMIPICKRIAARQPTAALLRAGHVDPLLSSLPANQPKREG